MDISRRLALTTFAGLTIGAAAGKAGLPASLLQRRIPSTGEPLPAIGLGTWQGFDVGVEESARAPLREVLACLHAAGARVVDTSPMYGRSEAVLGELASSLGLGRKLFFATKVWTTGREAGLRQMEQSFHLLRTARMDLMQVHNLVDVATHSATLAKWKDERRIRYMGITHYSASAYGEVERVLRAGSYDFLQINYSLLEREAEARLLPLAQERGVVVLINRPFAEGALFARVRGRPLPGLASEIGAASWAQLFLKWILAHPAVTCVLAGTARATHLMDNLGAGAGPLPDGKMRARIAALMGR
jgi:aryl-alcohol dehydrogenase-like predicted oxidoreductase